MKRNLIKYQTIEVFEKPNSSYSFFENRLLDKGILVTTHRIEYLPDRKQIRLTKRTADCTSFAQNFKVCKNTIGKELLDKFKELLVFRSNKQIGEKHYQKLLENFIFKWEVLKIPMFFILLKSNYEILSGARVIALYEQVAHAILDGLLKMNKKLQVEVVVDKNHKVKDIYLDSDYWNNGVKPYLSELFNIMLQW